MADYTIRAQTREITGKKLKASRAQGLLPAVVYGAGQTNKNLFINGNEFIKLYEVAGESSIIDLVVDGKDSILTLIKDYEADPKSNEFIHVDFQKINVNKKIIASVSLVFEGESPAAKNLGGTVVMKLDHVEIEALPTDLIHEITVDLSGLETFEDAIHISDLSVPENVTIIGDPAGLVVKVEEPREEEEEVVEAVSAADIPTVGEEGEAGEGETVESAEAETVPGAEGETKEKKEKSGE